MHRFFFIALILCITSRLCAQCVIDSSIQTSGFHPDTGSILRPACAGSQYEDFIQIYAPDTVFVGGSLYAVNYVKLDSIPDLPAGLSYTTNPSNGSMAGGERGCVTIYGSANVAPGLYNFTIYYTANFNLFGGTSLFFTAPYKIQVFSGTTTNNTVADTICSFQSYIFNGNAIVSSGTYQDTLINQAGCDSLLTLQLFVRPFDTLIYVELGTVHAPSGYANYQWYECGSGSLLPGSDSVFNNTVQTTNCYVSYSNDYCNYTSGCILLSSVRQYEWGEFIQVYPNPAEGQFVIKFANQKPQFLRMLDMLGNEVYVNKSPELETLVLTGNLSPAIYNLVADFGGFKSFRKIVLR